ncbi:MAG: 2-hydroxyacyl-CoA dehydratase [Spirochaetales bacterium]|nr:2-hydroxyacyl-CoA dehydratase [Spirochaetales bacterium]
MSEKEYRKDPPVASNAILNGLISGYYKEIMDAKNEKKTVCWEYQFQIAFLYAFENTIPVNFQLLTPPVENYARVAEYVEGKWELPKDLCSEVKAQIGHTLMPSLSKFKIPEPDYLITNHAACIQSPKSFDFLADYWNKEHYFMDNPIPQENPSASATEDHIEYVSMQFEQLIYEIEQKYHTPFNRKHFLKIIEGTLQLLVIYNEVLKINKYNPASIDGMDTLRFLLPLTTLNIAREYTKIMQLYIFLYNEIFERYLNNEKNGKKKEKCRLYWDAHLVPYKVNFLKNTLAKYGASIILNSAYVATCPYTREKEFLFDYPLTLEQVKNKFRQSTLFQNNQELLNYESLPTSELLARINAFTSGPKESLEKRCEKVKNIIEDFSIDAVIMNLDQNCRFFSLRQRQLQDYLVNELAIPTLVIQVDSLDNRQFSPAQFSTRIEAFLENIT